jgi:hypothetical protein
MGAQACESHVPWIKVVEALSFIYQHRKARETGATVVPPFPSLCSSGQRMLYFEFAQDRLAEAHALKAFELAQGGITVPSESRPRL